MTTISIAPSGQQLNPSGRSLGVKFDSINECVDLTPRVLDWAKKGWGIDPQDTVIEKKDDGTYVLWANRGRINALNAAIKHRLAAG